MAEVFENVKHDKQKLEIALEGNNSEEALRILTSLCEYKITYDVLKDTMIGKVVGKLRKHENPEIERLSNLLVDQWRQLVPGKTETSLNSNDSPSDNGDNKKRKKEDTKPVKKEESKKGKKEEREYSKSKPITGSNAELRNKIVEMIGQALGGPRDQDIMNIEDAAKSIEGEMYRLWPDCGRDYKAKFRSLSFNLKNPKNPDLRDAVMNGAISAGKLCSMSAHEMASDDLKKERERIAAYHMEAAKIHVGNQTSTDMFKCGKCGKRETTYYQLQTRSADEPMTTFHTCTFCGNRWKS